MLRKLYLLLVFILIFSQCDLFTGSEPSEFECYVPGWLKQKIETMSKDDYYWGTTVYRYEWRETFIYHIEIPVSSCAFCEIYYHNGEKIRLIDNAMLQDFQQNKKNRIVVWKWGS